MQITDLPFNQHLGLSVVNDVIQLTPAQNHENHVGTVHATVIFGVAEAASGHWLINSFSELNDGYVAVLRSTKLKYRRPADAGIHIIGTATCGPDSIAKFRDDLTDRGRATLEVSVKVLQNDSELLSGTMGWFVAQDG